MTYVSKPSAKHRQLNVQSPKEATSRKRILTLLLCAVLITAILAACTKEKPPKKEETPQPPAYGTVHTLCYKDSRKSDKAVATFFNSKTGQSEDVAMTKTDEDDSSVTFTCEGDAAAYNMAYVTCGDEKPNKFTKFAFNPCISGWYRTEDYVLPYTVGEAVDYHAAYDDITISGNGFDRKVHVWTPDDYDASSKEPYATVYVLDGQGFVFLGENGQELKGCPVVNEHVKAMTATTGQKAIVVAIENTVTRDYEMVPEIGQSRDEMIVESMTGEDLSAMYEEDSMNGSQFASFIAETIVPYIREHYNVYSDALHTAITGASLGGLECFYTTVEYPDVFGTCGALSPSFWEYDDATWRSYLGGKNFDGEMPVLYLYTGPQETGDTDPDVTEMVERLKDLGYPADKLILHFNEEGVHDSRLWRGVIPEFLAAMIYRQIPPLQQ